MEPTELTEEQAAVLDKFAELDLDQQANFLIKALTYFGMPVLRKPEEPQQEEPQQEQPS